MNLLSKKKTRINSTINLINLLTLRCAHQTKKKEPLAEAVAFSSNVETTPVTKGKLKKKEQSSGISFVSTGSLCQLAT